MRAGRADSRNPEKTRRPEWRVFPGGATQCSAVVGQAVHEFFFVAVAECVEGLL